MLILVLRECERALWETWRNVVVRVAVWLGHLVLTQLDVVRLLGWLQGATRVDV